MFNRGHNTFPYLGISCRFCKLSEIMCCYVVFPFQMMNFSAIEGEKKVLNSAKDVSKGAISFLCLNRLHNGIHSINQQPLAHLKA